MLVSEDYSSYQGSSHRCLGSSHQYIYVMLKSEFKVREVNIRGVSITGFTLDGS